MCTAVSFHHYFGRNLDLDRHYLESVIITPRNYTYQHNAHKPFSQNYAVIGMGTVTDGYPLYYDATNEWGLSIAGLNFPDFAKYYSKKSDAENVPPFALIPWLLSQCKNLVEARDVLQNVNLVNIPFSVDLPLTPLHWLISDKTDSIVLESTKDGIRIYDNSYGVLTNNPPFPYHHWNLCNYMNLTREIPQNQFAPKLKLQPYSLGMGGIGLPGDLSSSSRFIRAVFTKENSVCYEDEHSNVCQFFHILGSVAQQEGCVKTKIGYEKTIYSSCCNTDKCIYYYTTYNNPQITAIQMHSENLTGNKLICYALRTDTVIHYDN